MDLGEAGGDNEMNQRVYKKLKELAKEGKTIKYSELNDECNLD